MKKPIDASDVATPRGESAKAEVVRLRKLLADKKAAMPTVAEGTCGVGRLRVTRVCGRERRQARRSCPC